MDKYERDIGVVADFHFLEGVLTEQSYFLGQLRPNEYIKIVDVDADYKNQQIINFTCQVFKHWEN